MAPQRNSSSTTASCPPAAAIISGVRPPGAAGGPSTTGSPQGGSSVRTRSTSPFCTAANRATALATSTSISVCLPHLWRMWRNLEQTTGWLRYASPRKLQRSAASSFHPPRCDRSHVKQSWHQLLRVLANAPVAVGSCTLKKSKFLHRLLPPV